MNQTPTRNMQGTKEKSSLSPLFGYKKYARAKEKSSLSPLFGEGGKEFL